MKFGNSMPFYVYTLKNNIRLMLFSIMSHRQNTLFLDECVYLLNKFNLKSIFVLYLLTGCIDIEYCSVHECNRFIYLYY